ncbi:S8 family serine peptidase [Deinococcus sp.]|uniref:S8 family serine peptidase n=1 Tax=Deinococcus sp. TaxID=47478 RepID=UPI002869EAC0|nr:S8 family serine peptidase [Deinococcus sp.]
MKLTPAALAKFRANPLVEYVEQEALHHAPGSRHVSTDAAATGKPAPSRAPSPALSPSVTPQVNYTASGEYTWGDNALRVPALRTAGYTGAATTKVAVCVLDTGIDGNHPEFQNKLKGFRNFVTSETNRGSAYQTNDVSHHGTHASGTIYAQYGAGTGAAGLQPGEDLNGLGGVGLSAKATFAGSIVKSGDSIGTAGNNELCGTTTLNAALSGTIALISRGTCTFEEKVANAFASGAKAVMIYNNAARVLGMSLTNTYAIPVVGIQQTDGQTLLTKLPTTGTVAVTTADYEYFDGTSMATPHVSAAAAVVWAAKPTLTNTQLLSKLTSTAKDLGAVGRDDNFGYGLVDLCKAITGQ